MPITSIDALNKTLDFLVTTHKDNKRQDAIKILTQVHKDGSDAAKLGALLWLEMDIKHREYKGRDPLKYKKVIFGRPSGFYSVVYDDLNERLPDIVTSLTKQERLICLNEFRKYVFAKDLNAIEIQEQAQLIESVIDMLKKEVDAQEESINLILRRMPASHYFLSNFKKIKVDYDNYYSQLGMIQRYMHDPERERMVQFLEILDMRLTEQHLKSENPGPFKRDSIYYLIRYAAALYILSEIDSTYQLLWGGDKSHLYALCSRVIGLEHPANLSADDALKCYGNLCTFIINELTSKTFSEDWGGCNLITKLQDKDTKLDENQLAQVAIANKAPILIKQEEKYFMYGFVNDKWMLTELQLTLLQKDILAKVSFDEKNFKLIQKGSPELNDLVINTLKVGHTKNWKGLEKVEEYLKTIFTNAKKKEVAILEKGSSGKAPTTSDRIKRTAGQVAKMSASYAAGMAAVTLATKTTSMLVNAGASYLGGPVVGTAISLVGLSGANKLSEQVGQKFGSMVSTATLIELETPSLDPSHPKYCYPVVSRQENISQEDIWIKTLLDLPDQVFPAYKKEMIKQLFDPVDYLQNPVNSKPQVADKKAEKPVESMLAHKPSPKATEKANANTPAQAAAAKSAIEDAKGQVVEASKPKAEAVEANAKPETPKSPLASVAALFSPKAVTSSPKKDAEIEAEAEQQAENKLKRFGLV